MCMSLIFNGLNTTSRNLNVICINLIYRTNIIHSNAVFTILNSSLAMIFTHCRHNQLRYTVAHPITTNADTTLHSHKSFDLYFVQYTPYLNTFQIKSVILMIMYFMSSFDILHSKSLLRTFIKVKF